MTEIQFVQPNCDIVARAENFLKQRPHQAMKTAPPPKHEGKNRNSGKGRAFDWLCQHVSYNEKRVPFLAIFEMRRACWCS